MMPNSGLSIRNFPTNVRRVVSAMLAEVRQIIDEGKQRGGQPAPSDRKAEMLKAYREGASLRAVGERFGISGSRVQQLLKSMPDYQGARDALKSARGRKQATLRSTQRQPSRNGRRSPSTRRAWKSFSDNDGLFERLYRMREEGKKWKDLAEAAGRPGDRSNAHSTMLHMKRQSTMRGRPWPIRQKKKARS